MDFLGRTLLALHIVTEHLDKEKATEEEPNVIEEEPVKILPIGWYYLIFAILVVITVWALIYFR